MGSRSNTAGHQLAMEVARRKRKESEMSGLGRFVFDMRFRRHRYRQFIGVALVFWFTLAGAPTRDFVLIGAALATLGMAVRMWASGVVMKNEVLATVGPYGYVRHPLYVGNLLICVGFCFASGLWWSVPVSILYLWYFYPATIYSEDYKLRQRFPDQWDPWADRTRALIPSLTPYGDAGNKTSWSFKRSLMRNGEPLHIVVLGGCLIWLYLEAVG